jgi:phage recombination protein Bet
MTESLTVKPAETKEQKLIVVSQGRPPYPTRAKAAFNISPGDWRALVDAVWPAAKTTEAVELALSYCRARNLDPFKRPVHIVPVWDSKLRREVETIWPGIGELRTTASRTGAWAGNDEAIFGTVLERTFKGIVGKDQYAKEVEKTVFFPEWCSLVQYKMVQGQRVPFPGPRVRWLETYAAMGASDVPNEMWATRPFGQLEKCAEAASLRRAFPEEVGGEMIHDEIGRKSATVDVTPVFAEPGVSRTELLTERLSGEGAVIDATGLGEISPQVREENSKGEPAGPVQVADDLQPPPSRDALVEEIRALLKAKGKTGPARDEALQNAFGDPSWIRIVKFDAPGLAVGLAALKKLLADEDGLAAMAAEREPGQDEEVL